MAPPIGNPGDSADAIASHKRMLKGWAHLQHALGGNLNASVKRWRKLSRAALRGRKR